MQWLNMRTNDSAEIQDFKYPCSMKTLLYYNAAIVYGRRVTLPRVTISGKEIPNLEIILHSYSDNTATVGAAITTADTYIGGWVRFFCIGTI